MTRLHWLPITALITATMVLGCDLGGGTATPEPPAKPEYERSFDEFTDVPHQMTVQIAWAAEPIDEAVMLADEIAALRAKVEMKPEDFKAMCSVAFENGTVEIGAVAMADDVKIEVEATLAKIKAVGASLQTVPGRAKKAGQAISKMVMASPKLVLASSKELSAELTVAVGDGGAKIEADLDTVKALPAEVKAEAVAAKDVLAELPQKAQKATQNLVAAFKGEPFEPMAPTGDPEAGAEGTASGGVTASGGARASGEARASEGVSPPAIPTGSIEMSPTASLSPEAIKKRVSKLQRVATEVATHNDWLSSADAFEEAFVLTPDNMLLAYKVGEAAANAHDCIRAHIYLERFVTYGDPTLFAPEIAVAKKVMGELKTFECPPRTPEDEVARAQTLGARAEELSAEDDWGGAAALYALAYQLAPEDHAYAFHVAVASWNSRECEDAATYFAHFASVGDPKRNRSQLRETNRYQEEASAGFCPSWASGEREAHARDLYRQAQALDLDLDFHAAIDKYERAYYQLPDNHGLAYRIADSAWKAQLCDKASSNYQRFVENTSPTDPRYTSDLQTASQVLDKVSALGCPNALYGSADAAAAASAGQAGGAGDEKPPPTAAKSGGCALNPDTGPRSALFIGLLLLGAGLRRRR